MNFIIKIKNEEKVLDFIRKKFSEEFKYETNKDFSGLGHLPESAIETLKKCINLNCTFENKYIEKKNRISFNKRI